MSCKLVAGAAVMLLLSACESVQTRVAPQAGSLDAGVGEATKWNAAVQTINPDPVYAAGGAQPGDSGAKAAAASQRYRTDQVKQPEPATTTRKAGSTGGGGSGPR